MQAVIIYESLTGNTHAVARTIADELYDRKVASKIFDVSSIDAEAVAAADLVIVGTWTDGLLVIGQRPAKKKKLAKALPDLSGKACAVYCTYAITPGKTLEKLSGVVEAKGANVVGGLAIRREELAEGARDFTSRVLDVVSV